MKDSVLELVGLNNFHLMHLVANLEKIENSLNEKIINAIDHKEDEFNSTISKLVADKYKTSSENVKLKMELSQVFTEMTTANKKMKDEVEHFKNKLNSANKVIAAQNADLDRMKPSSFSFPKDQQKKPPNVDTKLKNLVRHVETNLRSFLSLVEAAAGAQGCRTHPSMGREEVERCRRVVVAAHQALTSLRVNRQGEVVVTAHHRLSWSILFERLGAEEVVGELLDTATTLAASHPHNQAWFFQRMLETREHLEEVVDALEQTYLQYD